VTFAAGETGVTQRGFAWLRWEFPCWDVLPG
jgi:hypothetical protein